MHADFTSAFEKREAQWSAFHQWESSSDGGELSLAERISWYRSAVRFALRHARPMDNGPHLQEKAKVLRRVQQRLSGLSSVIENG